MPDWDPGCLCLAPTGPVAAQYVPLTSTSQCCPTTLQEKGDRGRLELCGLMVYKVWARGGKESSRVQQCSEEEPEHYQIHIVPRPTRGASGTEINGLIRLFKKGNCLLELSQGLSQAHQRPLRPTTGPRAAPDGQVCHVSVQWSHSTCWVSLQHQRDQ